MLRPSSFRMRLATCSLVALLCVAPAYAQRGVLPQETMLNRVGLTLAWWGQASISPSQERVEYVTADEVNVYVQGGSGMITTFSGESGRRMWSRLVDVPFKECFAVSSNDEQVLLSVGTMIYSLHKVTGNVLWSLKVPSQPSASPTVDSQRLYFGTSSGSIYTYDLAMIRQLYQDRLLPEYSEGAKLWRFTTSREIVSPPIVSPTTVMFASQNGIAYGLVPESKSFKFQLDTGTAIRAPLGASRDQMFVADRNARMYCLSQDNGRVRWVFSSGTPIPTRPLVLENSVLVIPHHRGLVSLNRETGAEEWRQPQAVKFVAGSATRLYASDASDNLLILDRATGRILGTLDMRLFGKRFTNDRTDRIVMSTDDGAVICLKEIGSEFPVYHNWPEREPILPVMAADEPQ